MTEPTAKTLLDALEPYPLMKKCLACYVNWCVENVTEDWESYDLIDDLRKDEVERLRKYEERLSEAQRILGVPETDFAKKFVSWTISSSKTQRKYMMFLRNLSSLLTYIAIGSLKSRSFLHSSSGVPTRFEIQILLLLDRIISSLSNSRRSVWKQSQNRNMESCSVTRRSLPGGVICGSITQRQKSKTKVVEQSASLKTLQPNISVGRRCLRFTAEGSAHQI